MNISTEDKHGNIVDVYDLDCVIMETEYGVVYLTKEQARELAAALILVAESLE
ncbi:hypothetical protein CSP48_004019 [Salmonella enterica subsp. arizonae]|nr:hypothetical protein [Salmonella enterica subsp. arizonae]